MGLSLFYSQGGPSRDRLHNLPRVTCEDAMGPWLDPADSRARPSRPAPQLNPALVQDNRDSRERQLWAPLGSTDTNTGTIQGRLAWPLHKDDTQIHEAFRI